MKFNRENKDIVNDYISFFIEHNFGILSKYELHFNYKHKQSFYVTPYVFNNVILDSLSEYDLLNTILQIKKYSSCIKTLQIRMFFEPSSQFMNLLLSNLYDYNFINLELLFNYKTHIDVFKEIFNKYSKLISKIIIMNNQTKQINQDCKLTLRRKPLINCSQCGIISKKFFMINMDTYTQSCFHNTCLHKKISIDENGYIKNCPSMKKHYGHISDTDIKEVVQSEEFQKLWHIKKDDIKVCQDCEFRHMCMDCRAYIKDPNDIYSQPAKCPYNPYIAKWQGQEGYITVEQWQKQNPNWEQQAKEQRQTTY